RISEIRRVPDVPATTVTCRDDCSVAQINLTLLAVDIYATGASPHRDPCRHLPVGLVGPVDRHLTGGTAGEEQRAVNLIMSFRGKDFAQRGSADSRWCTQVPSQQIDRMSGIVIEATTSFGLSTAPRRAFGLQHDRPVRLD